MEDLNWNQRCSRIIRREKAEIEKKYGIRFPGIRREREVIPPQTLFPRDDWRERLGIKIEDSKEIALEKFREWRDLKRTCERCLSEEKAYSDCCPLFAICEEADQIEEKEVRENGEREESGSFDTRTGGVENFELEEAGIR